MSGCAKVVLAALLVGGAALLSGCTASARATLEQEFAPAAQRRLTLASDWAFSAADGQQTRCLLAFPLPGAQDGPRDFLLYVRAPAGAGEVGVAGEQPGAARGFLIQRVGALRGKTLLRSGTLRITRDWPSRDRAWLRFQFVTDDGARITGDARTLDDPRELTQFEREHAGDIAALEQPQTRPADEIADATSDATPPRPRQLTVDPAPAPIP